MCIICVKFQLGKLNIKEARRALFEEILSVDPYDDKKLEHLDEIAVMLDINEDNID